MMSPFDNIHGFHESRTQRLSSWASSLSFEQIPNDVVQRIKELFLDWAGCCVAGREHASVTSMLEFARIMGPSTGQSELVGFPPMKTSPYFAAMVNGACSHVVEQDDLHNASMMHPATVVFPAALAVAQDRGCDGKDFITACAVGYEFACRVGEFLGREHYKNYHGTATTGVLGATAAAAYLMELDTETFISAIGTAGTQAAGLWQFLLDATHSKQVHTARACANGVYSAHVASSGLLGPGDILEGKKGMAATLNAMPSQPDALDSSLGEKWSAMGSSFKWHASCRHTHPSVDALLALMDKNSVEFQDIETVTSYTYEAAISILSMSEKAETVHQSKFSMGFVLAVAAKYGHAMITDFTEEALHDEELRQFQSRVKMVFDENIDALFPRRWTGRLQVVTKSGMAFTESIDIAKGDPGWTLTREEIEAKAKALSKHGKARSSGQIADVIRKVWNLENEESMNGFAFK